MSFEAFDEIVRQFLLTLWNVYSFFVTYANANGFDPASSGAPPVDRRAVMDRWVLSQLADTVREARERLDAYDATGAGRRIQSFVSDLSNWYVRRTRRRFWNPGGVAGADAEAAAQTLHHCLVTVATTPGALRPLRGRRAVAEPGGGAGWRCRTRSTSPTIRSSTTPPRIPHSDRSMALARAVVELGRRIRVETKTKTRQPLHEAVVHVPGRDAELDGLLDVIADELNVKAVRFADTESFGAWRAKPNYKVLGPALGGRVQAVAAALCARRRRTRRTLGRGRNGDVDAGGRIDGDPPARSGRSRTGGDVGLGVASESGVTVALELEIPAELRREGIARDLIQAIQDLRNGGAPRERSDRGRGRSAGAGRRGAGGASRRDRRRNPRGRAGARRDPGRDASARSPRSKGRPRPSA